MLSAHIPDVVPTDLLAHRDGDQAVVVDLDRGYASNLTSHSQAVDAIAVSSLLPNLPGLHLVLPAQVQGQVIYLNFAGATDVRFDGPVQVDHLNVPAFKAPAHLTGLEKTIPGLVVDQLNQTFAGSGLSFTAQRPQDGQAYATVYIGGDGSAIAGAKTLAGVAEQVDVGNLNPADEAFVFSDSVGSGDGLAGYVTALSSVVSHEVGHLLGYAHNQSSTNPTALSEVASEIQGATWLDANGNGVKDAGETGIPGWTINLNNGRTATTDANGNYRFTDLAPGTYKVSEELVPGWSQTYPVQNGTVSQEYAWTQTTDGASSGSKAEATVVRADASGSIILAGTFEGTVDLAPSSGLGAQTSQGSSDIFVTKLNPDGTHAWTRTIGGGSEDLVDNLIVDPSGNIFVGGAFGLTVDFDPTAGTDLRSAGGYSDGFLLKLNPDGTYGWAKTFGGAGAFTRVFGVDRDRFNNLYLTGTFSQTVDFNPGPGTDLRSAPGDSAIFVTRINADGTYGWTRTMGGYSLARGMAVSADSSGNLYVTGHFRSTVDFNPGAGIDNHSSSGDWDIFLAKFRTNGDYIWSKRIGGADWDMAYDMGVDASDNVYVAGLFSGLVDFNPDAGQDFQNTPHPHVGAGFLTRFNADGSYAWTRVLGEDAQRLAATGLSLDQSGNLYVVGERMAKPEEFQNDSQSDLFISKFNPDGQFVWKQQFTDIAPTQTEIYTPWRWDVATNAQGELLVCGRFSGSRDFNSGTGTDMHTAGGTYDAFVIKQKPVSFSHTITLGQDQVAQNTDFGNRVTGKVNLIPMITSFGAQGPTPASAGYTHERQVNVSLEAVDISGTIQGWMITESATPPSVVSPYWSSSKPDTYLITGSGDGIKTLYAWVKDNDGNVSALTARSQTQITLDTVAPTVTVTPRITADGTPSLTGTIDNPQASVEITVNGTTYTAVNGGDGLWTLADDTISPALASGTYDVLAEAQDLAGNRGIDATTNELVVDRDAATATVQVSNVYASGLYHTFTVTYQAGRPIDVSSLDGSDIRVTGPNGYDQLAVLVGVDNDTNGTPRIATYRITGPGGRWNVAANGTYAVSMRSNQVHDTGSPARYVQAGVLGQFQVSIVLPTVSIGDATILEGDSGQNSLEFNVTLSSASADPVTVDYATADDTAQAGSDYTAVSGTMTFDPGQTSQKVSVTVQGDKVFEPDETFYVNLSNPANCTVADGQAVGTIQNDDAAPVPPAEYFQGKSGDNFDLKNKAILFTPDVAGTAYVPLLRQISNALPTDPAGGTTLSLGDNDSVQVSLTGGKTVTLFGESFSQIYVGSNGYLTFTQSDTDPSESWADHFRTKRVSGLFTDMTPRSDSRISYKQLADRVVVTWQNVGQYSIQTARNTFQIEMYFDGRIQIAWLSMYAAKGIVGLSDGKGLRLDFRESDFSSSDRLPILSIKDASLAEGNSGAAPINFEVQLSNAIGQDVTVKYTTVAGTATAGSDFTPVSGTLTIPAGQTAGTISVPVLGDGVYERDETFYVNLSQPAYALISNAQAVGTILNDDPVVLPVVHSITIQSLGPDVPGYTDRRQVKVAVSANDPDGVIAGWAITESAAAPAPNSTAWQAARPERYTIAGSGDGLKTLYAWVKDNYDAVSELTDQSKAQITLDTTGPVVTVRPLRTKDTTPPLTGTVDDPTATVQVTVGGKTYDAVNNGDGTWILADNKIAPSLPDGSSEVAVVATDRLGNKGTDSTTNEVNVDNISPSLASWGPAEDTGVDTQDKVTKTVPLTLNFTFTEPVKGVNADITVTAPDGRAVTPDSITGWGTDTVAVRLKSPLPQGRYTVTLSGSGIKDLVDNPFNGGSDQSVQVTLDTLAPTVQEWTLDESQPGIANPVRTTDQSPVLTFRFSEKVFGTASDVSVTGPDSKPVPVHVSGWATDGTYTLTLTFDQPLTRAGLYTVSLHAANTITDLAGNALNSGTDVVVPFMLDAPMPRMGGEFEIPSTTAGDQFKAAVDADAQGNFVVAWYGPAASGGEWTDVYVRRFDAGGNPLGPQQLVNTEPVDPPALASGVAVAVTDDGRFVVAWEKAGVLQTQVQLRVFDPDGTPASDVVTMGPFGTYCYQPDVVINPTTGEFVVAYTGQSGGLVVPGNMYGPQVYVQRFAANGTAVGDPVQVSGPLSGYGKAPHLVMDGQGKVLVVWNADMLFGRFVTADGQIAGDEFVVVDHSVGEGLTQTTSVVMDAQGNFVVAWDEASHTVWARRFSANGAALGDAFRVNGPGASSEPTICMDSEGRLLIAWSNMDRDGDGSGVYARRYNADGTAVGQDIRVNTQRAGEQYEPAMAVGGFGRILVAWTTDGTTTDGQDIHGQLFDFLAPKVTVNRLATDLISPGLSGTVDEPETTVQVTVAGQTQTATNNGDGTWTVAVGQFTLPPQDTAYDVQVTAMDAAGNVGADSTTNELLFDREPPRSVGLPLLAEDTGINGDGLTGDTTPEVTFTFSEPVFGDASAVEAQVTPPSDFNGYAAESIPVLPDEVVGWGTNKVTVKFTTPLTQDGDYLVFLHGESVLDRADKPANGGQDALAGFTLDKTVPSVFIDNDRLVTDNLSPVLRGYLSDATAEVRVKIGNKWYAATNNLYVDGTETWAYNTASELKPGQYDVVVTATDRAGNVGTSSGTLIVLMAKDNFDDRGQTWESELFFARWAEVFEGDQDVPAAATPGQTRSWGPDPADVTLTQVSNIYSSSKDQLARKGTYLMFKEGTDWTDYKVSYSMRSEDDGDFGLMFRVKDANNYYRFSWNRAQGERRLVKSVGGKFTLLASDKAVADANRYYDVTVLVDGSLVEVYIGEDLVFSVKDTDLTQGTIAFYCHNNNNAYFDNFKVENQVNVNQPPRIMSFSAAATRIFDTQTVQFSADAFDPDDGRPVAYKWVLEEGQGTFSDSTIANPVFTPANVTALMLAKIHLEVSDGTATTKSKTVTIEVYDNDATVFLNDDFNDGNTNGWIVKDQGPAKSAWNASTGVLTQKADAVTSMVYEAGTIWTQVQTDVDMRSNTDGAMGALFRYQDENNTYRFVWNNQDGTRRLQRVQNGQVTDLASDKAKFVKGQMYKVSIIAFGQYLAVDIDGQRIFGVTDATFAAGTIGLYCSKNKDASFDNVVVKNLKDADLSPVITSMTAVPVMVKDSQTVQCQVAAYDPDSDPLTYRWLSQSGQGTFSDPNIANPVYTPADVTGPTTVTLAVEVSDGSHTVNRTVDVQVLDAQGTVLVNDDFSDGQFDGWKVVDQGTSKGPSKWSAASGAMVQSSGIYKWLDGIGKRGTFAKYVAGTAWTDYEATVSLKSTSDGDIGLMFRAQDDNNYYRFSMNAKENYRRLVKCQGGKFTQMASVAGRYVAGQTYEVKVLVLGSLIKVYVDNTEIFSVTDKTFAKGSIALYSSANPGASFDNVVVRSQRSEDQAPTITSVTATPASIRDNQTSQLRVEASEPDGQPLTYRWTAQSGQGTISNATIANPIYTPPDVTATQTFTLTVEVSDGSHTISRTVDVQVLDAGAPGPIPTPTQLLADDFSDGQFDGWQVVDQGNGGGPSKWSAASGKMVQSSGIYRWFDSLGKRGTFAKYVAGTAWTDYETTLNMQSTSNGDIGLMFRVQDDNNYYRFSMNANEGYRRLVKSQGGKFTQLASASGGYAVGQTYRVKISVQGSSIKVSVDGTEIFSVSDTTLTRGSIALYCSGNSGSTFDDVLVQSL